ncbi:hypothetical protein PoB_003888600 [Plakobranchus ocellatus]|uniref:Peptidase M12B domain-containing protein n=1 Tax=Plakobranchus ocellatus TaxID=259542 RepID=A0AAV4AW18_9GAST|nr:hypothetical protein PoB_003888600 [Plakobranchus ocellatus]
MRLFITIVLAVNKDKVRVSCQCACGSHHQQLQQTQQYQQLYIDYNTNIIATFNTFSNSNFVQNFNTINIPNILNSRAYFGQMCSRRYSVGIVFYDMTYQVSINTAQVLGIIMGARNDPANSGYLMDSSLSTTDTNRWKFSVASRNALNAFLAKPSNSRCLKRSYGISTAPSAGVTAALANPETICRRARRSKRTYMCKTRRQGTPANPYFRFLASSSLSSGNPRDVIILPFVLRCAVRGNPLESGSCEYGDRHIHCNNYTQAKICDIHSDICCLFCQGYKKTRSSESSRNVSGVTIDRSFVTIKVINDLKIIPNEPYKQTPPPEED